MRMLFTPAIGLMNRLKYPQKFALISLLFAMPLALVMVLLLSEINLKIDFAQKEIYGDAYLRPLRHLLEDSLHDRVLARGAAGNASYQTELQANEARIAA